jgi:hypothetical protein
VKRIATLGGHGVILPIVAHHLLTHEGSRARKPLDPHEPLTAQHMRVHILTARTIKAHNSIYPLRAFRHLVRRRGIVVRVYFRDVASLTQCDVLCILGEHWKHQASDRPADSMLDVVRRYRDSVPTLVWLDTTDSSGTTRFEVLPYVDLYAKKQLLKDRSRYTASFYGMRCYTDYYHRTNGITDSNVAWRTPAHPQHLDKLAVSWNLGLGSYICRNNDLASRLRRLRVYWPFAKYVWNQTSASSVNRSIDVNFRGRIDYERATITFQRRETYRRLMSFASATGCTTPPEGRLPYDEYRDELRRSKLVLSPFGFGEMNIRDVECFVDGAALVKPDMSHLVTWPDYFEAGVTHVQYAWDFSDFEATLARMLANPDERFRIANAGQERYVQSLSEEGGRAFVDHLEALLQQAQRNSLR